MGKHSLSSIAKSVRTAMKKHSPEILTGIGIAGMITTTVMAVRATPKALILIEEKKDELETDQLSGKEIVKTAWPCYIPAAIVGSVSVFCLIGASSTNLRRNAALATAYTLSESTLKEYQEKVVEAIGDKKEQTIRESMAKEKIMKNPVREVILTEKGGNTICYDAISGRYFSRTRHHQPSRKRIEPANAGRHVCNAQRVLLCARIRRDEIGRRSGLEYRKGIYRT